MSATFTIAGTTSSVTLHFPDSYRWGEGREHQILHEFTGASIVYDAGMESQVLTFSGTEWSVPTSKFSDIDTIMENNEEVTLSSFTDDILDATWVVSHYEYTVERGYMSTNINAVVWSITFEKT